MIFIVVYFICSELSIISWLLSVLLMLLIMCSVLVVCIVLMILMVGVNMFIVEYVIFLNGWFFGNMYV